MYLNKNIVVFGGTGLIGSNFVELLIEKNYQVSVFVRKQSKRTNPKVRYIDWDYKNKEQIKKELENIFAVVNLTGSPISQKWSNKNLENILKSRIETTKIIVEAINDCQNPPNVLLQASAIGYYEATKQGVIDEFSDKGSGILSQICSKWEAEAQNIREDVRLVIIRTGIVLGNEGGFLEKITKPIENYFGTIIGTGKQILPWIHIYDQLMAMLLLLENSSMYGVFNIVAPQNCTMEQLCKKAGKILGRPVWLKIPNFVVKLLFGKMGEELLLSSQNIEPKFLKEAYFQWKYNKIDEALEDLLNKK